MVWIIKERWDSLVNAVGEKAHLDLNNANDLERIEKVFESNHIILDESSDALDCWYSEQELPQIIENLTAELRT
jgi:hypothetical protein